MQVILRGGQSITVFIDCRGRTAVREVRGAQRANYALKEERSGPSMALHIIGGRGASALIDCLQVKHEARYEDGRQPVNDAVSACVGVKP